MSWSSSCTSVCRTITKFSFTKIYIYISVTILYIYTYTLVIDIFWHPDGEGVVELENIMFEYKLDLLHNIMLEQKYDNQLKLNNNVFKKDLDNIFKYKKCRVITNGNQNK